MRCLGEIDGRKRTETFVAFLLTEGISAQIDSVDAAKDRWQLWIRQEDQLPVAREHLYAFVNNPDDPRYIKAMESASQILAEKEKQRKAAAKNIRRMEVRPRSAMSGPIPPLTLTLLILSIVISLVTTLGKPKPTNEWGVAVVKTLSFVSQADYIATEGDPAASLRKGEVWRAITPIFLHLSMFHLAMNMFMLVSFGRMVERWLGTPRYALFVLLLAVGSNLLQGLMPEALQGSPFFGGISGVLYGFFGYVWVRSSINPMLGVSIPMPVAMIFVGIIVLGLSGVFPSLRLAHLAHLGGLLIGAAMGFVAERR